MTDSLLRNPEARTLTNTAEDEGRAYRMAVGADLDDDERRRQMEEAR